MKASDYKYCPRCKSKLENTKEAFRCGKCGMVIYKNSAASASVLILDGNNVLLARRNAEPFKGKYDVVGGFLEYGEHPLHAVLREAKEETGLRIQILDMLGVYMDTYGRGGKSTLNFYYVGRILSGKMKAQDDVAGLEWFPLRRLPEPAFNSQRQVFKDLRKWVRKRNAAG